MLEAYLTSCTSLPAFTEHSGLDLPAAPEEQEGSFTTLYRNASTTMEAASSLYEKDLHCPQCSGIYCLPVLLKCGHNICRVCLQKFWEWKGCRECPVCGTVCVPGRPPINLALKIAADNFQTQRTSGDQDLCSLHNEKLTIFCQNDEEPICLVCQTSKQHKVHECCPVEEAAQQKKVKIETGDLLYIHSNT